MARKRKEPWNKGLENPGIAMGVKSVTGQE